MVRGSVQSIERALAILMHLCGRAQAAGVTELASSLRLAKSTVHRLLSTLEGAGVVVGGADGTYRPGLKLWEMGCAVVRSLDVREVARPIMQALAHKTGETVHLSAWDRGEVVYIDKIDGTNPLRIHSTLGGRAPAHAVASGLAFLAFRDGAASAEGRRERLERFTGRTITTFSRLQSRLEEIRRQGYALSVGAWHPDSAGVAAPIRSHAGDVIAVISVAGPRQRVTARAGTLARQVRTAAVEISRALGDAGTQGSPHSQHGDRQPALAGRIYGGRGHDVRAQGRQKRRS